jgi:hypothetical protein
MRAKTALTAAALAAACGGGPGPGEAGYDYAVSGAYAGTLVVEGERFAARLVLRTERGARVSGTFSVGAPFDIEARVNGALVEDLLRLTVSYESAGSGRCNGSIEGVITVSEAGSLLEGPVTIVDCGEDVPGRMSFRR